MARLAHPADIARPRIFDGLMDADRRVWLDASSLRLLKRKQALARQGDPAHSFYLVESGRLKLVQVTVDGHELIVRFVGPGEPFGGVVALDGATYPVPALAAEPSRLRAWPPMVVCATRDRGRSPRVISVMRAEAPASAPLSVRQRSPSRS